MKTIVCFGDSITDMRRDREGSQAPFTLGMGYPFLLEARLGKDFPLQYNIVNRGCGGHRSLDCAARIKEDLWNHNPDIVLILVGINDVWHGLHDRGVELPRFERTLIEMIEDTKSRFPNVKIALIEPSILHGAATDVNFEHFAQVYDYAAATKKIAKEHGCVFCPLQERFSKAAEKYGDAYVLYDGVHPTIQGSRLILETVMENVFGQME